MAIKIALDAGHGLKTSGKQTPDGIKEWTLNNKVVKYIVEYLAAYDVEYVFTDGYEGLTDEALTQRYNAYINAGVKAFVSIHHNAYTGKWNNATGVEVFVDKNATAADLKLAGLINDRLSKYTGLKNRGIKRENWLVINQNKIPAVLVEGGFMDSNIDYKVITSETGQQAYAKAVAEGLVEFLALKPRSAKVETYSGYVKVLANELNLRSKPSWNDDAVCDVVKKGAVLKIVGRIKVEGVYMYKLNDGTYVTSAGQYVQYMKNLSVTAGSKVKIKKGAKYGGLSTSRGKAVPASVVGKKYTVTKLGKHKGVEEALIKEINSWVAVSYCELIS